MKYFDNGKIKATPHNEETLKRHVGIPAYEAWRELTLTNFSNGFDFLTKQLEFN